jgi:hypothetical protein
MTLLKTIVTRIDFGLVRICIFGIDMDVAIHTDTDTESVSDVNIGTAPDAGGDFDVDFGNQIVSFSTHHIHSHQHIWTCLRVLIAASELLENQ